MPKKHLLSALEVKNAKAPEKGTKPLNDGAGLRLIVSHTGHKYWDFRRRQSDGKTLPVKIGDYPDMSLAKARDLAGEIWKLTSAGALNEAARDAVLKKQNAEVMEDAGLPSPDVMTFDKAAERFIDTRIEPEARNAKHVSQWRNTIRDYVSPVFGDLPVDQVTKHHVLAAVEPIWLTKTETAKRVRQRIERILGWSITMEYREGPNPAQWRDHLDNVLPSPYKLIRQKKKHLPSMPYADLPEFWVKLQEQPGVGAQALSFLILTAARPGEVRSMEWEDVDLDEALWMCPPHKMKNHLPHTVPLSKPAVKLLKAIPNEGGTVFRGVKGKTISENTINDVLGDMNIDNATSHGYRSSFKVWCQEKARVMDEVSEIALSHVNSDETRSAYAKSDLIDERRRLMKKWGRYVTRELKEQSKKLTNQP